MFEYNFIFNNGIATFWQNEAVSTEPMHEMYSKYSSSKPYWERNQGFQCHYIGIMSWNANFHYKWLKHFSQKFRMKNVCKESKSNLFGRHLGTGKNRWWNSHLALTPHQSLFKSQVVMVVYILLCTLVGISISVKSVIFYPERCNSLSVSPCLGFNLHCIKTWLT